MRSSGPYRQEKGGAACVMRHLLEESAIPRTYRGEIDEFVLRMPAHALVGDRMLELAAADSSEFRCGSAVPEVGLSAPDLKRRVAGCAEWRLCHVLWRPSIEEGHSDLPKSVWCIDGTEDNARWYVLLPTPSIVRGDP